MNARPRTRRGAAIPPLAAVALLAAALATCEAPGAAPVTVHSAAAATLQLPPVPNAPLRLQVVAYGLEEGAGPELGQCAVRLRDPVNLVDWFIDAAQTWEEPETMGDTTYVRHTTIGDYIPGDLATYGMTPGQVVRVDCAAYGVLGLANQGG
ncbi:MAG: hypothetical protein AMXMBFR53_24920 [Gemmatimonadota bacterium]